MNDKLFDVIANFCEEDIIFLSLHTELCILCLNLKTLAIYIIGESYFKNKIFIGHG